MFDGEHLIGLVGRLLLHRTLVHLHLYVHEELESNTSYGSGCLSCLAL